MAITATETYNTDVYGIVRRANRYIVELVKSQSSGLTKTVGFDVIRAKSYIKSLRSYHDHAVGDPSLDLPETGPTSIALPSNPVIPPMENDSIFDLVTLLELARDELVNSQSSRMSTNLIGYDSVRFLAILDKADNFIDKYVLVVDPIDQPETSPSQPMTGPGSRGV
jgi:hypothetical protein